MVARAHVVLPEDLIEQVDKVAGKRKRSQFIESAIREKLERGALTEALREVKGIIDLADYPEWQTPEGASAWVRESRRLDDEHRTRRLRDRQS